MNLSFLRVLKLLKMIRVIRIVRALRFFSLLRLYVDQIFGSMLNLLWLFVILFVILFIFSIAFVQGVADYLIMHDYPKSTDESQMEKAQYLRRAFRSVPMGILTIFKAIAGGDSWGPLEEHLADI